MPSPELKFLSRDQVERYHQESLTRFGGAAGVRSVTGLESAMAAPVNDFLYLRADLFEIAAAYAFHIAQAQSYIDGNKRTAAACALAFLEINGVQTAVNAFPLYEALVAVGEGRMTKAGLATRFRALFNSGEK